MLHGSHTLGNRPPLSYIPADMRIQIHNGLVLLPGGIRETDIGIVSGRIAALGKLPEDREALHIDAKGHYALPGFIDVHANGIAGFDLTNGEFDASTGSFSRSPERYTRGLERALSAFAATGTTLLGFSVLAAPIRQLKQVFALIASYRREHTCFQNDMLFGIYVEGTFMKERATRGAHNPKYFHAPSVRLFRELQRAAGGNIRIVNVVPEWGASAFTLIRHLAREGIVCATGHSAATGAEYQAAVDGGSTLAIHVMNGPSSSSSKPFDGGGVLETLLQSEGVYAEIIADGFHVDRRYVLDVIERKGIDRCMIVTDSMFVSGMKGIREFRVSGVRGRLDKGGEYIRIAGRGNALYGSVLTMERAFQNVLNWLMTPTAGVWTRHHRGHTFEEALLRTSRLCSASPAKALGVYDASAGGADHNLSYGTGEIAEGKRADIVIADITTHRDLAQLRVEQTIVNGHPVPRNRTPGLRSRPFRHHTSTR
jgi:N-acetylglucosamine-6-phosphate deacetylase